VRALALILVAASCAHTAAGAADPQTRIASGRAVTAGGIKAMIGAPVQVEVSFKDDSPACVMTGAVQLVRDTAHRWVWLEPTGGCPEWLNGRWWAELATGPGGWVMTSISSQAVEQ
jgi:hypothetical protein